MPIVGQNYAQKRPNYTKEGWKVVFVFYISKDQGISIGLILQHMAQQMKIWYFCILFAKQLNNALNLHYVYHQNTGVIRAIFHKCP